MRLLEELKSARVVRGPDAPALLVEQAEGQLGLTVALISTESVPISRLFQVFLNAVTVLVLPCRVWGRAGARA